MRRILVAVLLLFSTARADEMSSADKLRVVYSNQFEWTKDGLPLVTVRVAEKRERVVLSSPGMRLLPDGEGGAEVRGGSSWTVTVENARPQKVKWHAVAGRARGAEAEELRRKFRGARFVELGSLFAIRGDVVDARETLALDEKGSDTGEPRSAHPLVIERASGTVVATDERGTVVRSDAILWFSPAPGGLVEVRDVDKEGGGKEHRRYFGKIYVTVDGSGQLAVVNAVPEDKLLAGLVPAEMSPSSPVEALKAQAVAARNELLAKVGTRHLTDPYRLCSTQHCQVYAGAGHEDPRSTAAVEATRGEVLLTESDGRPIDTVYSAACGGHTEDNDRAWGGAPDPSLRGHLDGGANFRITNENVAEFLAAPQKANCARATNFRWQKPIDLGAVEKKLALGKLREVVPLERGVSGRVVKLQVKGDGGEKEVRGELEIRRALGNLKSALFVLDGKKDAAGHLTELTARGGGHGHGIGMCQSGAVGLAQEGAGYKQILMHYYAGARLKRLY